MNKETVKAIQEAITPLAQKLGEGGAQLYGVFVKQMFVEAIYALLLLLVGVIVGRATWKLCWWLYEDEKKRRGSVHEEAQFVICLVGMAGAFLAGVLVFINLGNAVGKFINPEYYAIQRMAETVKQ